MDASRLVSWQTPYEELPHLLKLHMSSLGIKKRYSGRVLRATSVPGQCTSPRVNSIMERTTKLSWPRRPNKEGWSFPARWPGFLQPHIFLDNLKIQKAADYSSSNETISVDHFFHCTDTISITRRGAHRISHHHTWNMNWQWQPLSNKETKLFVF